jgi:hypothetical protein
MPESSVEHYLGDGLYASFDGYSVILRSPRLEGDHWVALEPQVWNELIQWKQSLTTEKKESLP